MQAYLQRLAQHLASFVAVERRRKAKIEPTNRRAVVRVWYRRSAVGSSCGLPTWSRTLANKHRPTGYAGTHTGALRSMLTSGATVPGAACCSEASDAAGASGDLK